MPRPDYDVVIIGAGLAGLQLARRLARSDLRVMLADVKRTVGERVHTTGIFVRRTLEDFDLPPSALGPPMSRVVLRSPRGRGLQIEGSPIEFRFGDMAAIYETLREKATEDGVQWRPRHRFVSAERHGQTTLIRLATPDGHRTLRTRFLVGADGARSRVARDLGLSRNRRLLVGGEHVFHRSTPNPEAAALHCYLHPELAPGYIAWVADDGRHVHVGLAGHLDRVSLRASLNCFVDSVREEHGLEPMNHAEHRVGLIPIGGVLPRLHNDRGLLVGDAAGAVSPLTAGGLDACLRLSRAAAELIPRHLNGDPLALRHYDGRWLRRRLISRRAMRWLFDHLQQPQIIEALFSAAARGVLTGVARHVFFGRGSFPDLRITPLIPQSTAP